MRNLQRDWITHFKTGWPKIWFNFHFNKNPLYVPHPSVELHGVQSQTCDTHGLRILRTSDFVMK
jgi:hypothetical protein